MSTDPAESLVQRLARLTAAPAEPTPEQIEAARARLAALDPMAAGLLVGALTHGVGKP
jgi:hypothetical protein